MFLGLVVGSACATVMANSLNYKLLLAISFLGNGAGLLLFTISKEFWALCLARFMSGFFQVVLTIYIPLYADTFGTPTTRPIMMSMILVAGPIGVVAGYGVTAIIIGNGYSWRWSFFVQGFVMAGSFVVTCLVPGYLLNINEALDLKRQEKEKRNGFQENPVPEIGGTGGFRHLASSLYVNGPTSIIQSGGVERRLS